MATRLPNDFVIIAPKGEKNSSISDQAFENYKKDSGAGRFIELTIEQYGAWAITANSLEIEYSYTYEGAGDPPAIIRKSFTMDLKRRKRDVDLDNEYFNDYYKDAFYGPTNPIWIGVNRDFPILDFPGMAPGHLNASLPITSFFKATKEEIYNPDFGSWIISAEPYARAELATYTLTGIKPFYHRDKFYLWADKILEFRENTMTVTPRVITLQVTEEFDNTKITFTLKD